MLTPEQLAAMKAAAEEGARLWAAATAPPWTVFAELNLRAPDPRPGRYTKQPTTQCPLTNSGLELEQKAINIRFIAHARNTEYPAMLSEAVAEIERLNAVVAKYEADGAEYRELALKLERKCGSLVAALEDYNHAVELVVYRDSIDQSKAPLADAKEAT